MVTLKIYWWNLLEFQLKICRICKILETFPPNFPWIASCFSFMFSLKLFWLPCGTFTFFIATFCSMKCPSHAHTHTDTAVGLPFSPAAPRWRLPPSHTSWHLRCRCRQRQRQRQRRRVSLFLQSRGVRCISFCRGLRLSCVMTFKRQSEATAATTTKTATRINAATQ